MLASEHASTRLARRGGPVPANQRQRPVAEKEEDEEAAEQWS